MVAYPDHTYIDPHPAVPHELSRDCDAFITGGQLHAKVRIRAKALGKRSRA